ncbi:glycosyl hydrolase-related protein [bacterium]|nr:glycosyl hydrolase-related protein [bacterium]
MTGHPPEFLLEAVVNDPKPVYHFISHSHWDREWYKPFETFRLDLVDMINSLLDIFADNPDYQHFALDGQTVILEDYAEIMLGRTDELKQLIQAGKISIGPWYILPDEFLVSGESTVRNLLFGRKVAESFGPVMQIGYIPDSFGHLGMMPAILQGFDIDSAIVYRGFGGEPGQDKSEYRWRSPDGSEVLMMHLPPNGYGDAYIGSQSPDAYRKKAGYLKEILDPRATTPHRLCMNGGDHHFPESYLPEALQAMGEASGDVFLHSSIPAYVQAVKNHLAEEPLDLNLIEGELRWGFRYAFVVQSGIYSTRMYLKQANHACEKRLTRYAEPMAIWAELANRHNLSQMLQQAWKLLLQNHPHDSICGCSVDSVHREMMNRFEKCEQIGEAVIEKSLHHFFPDKEVGSENIFLFNPVLRPANRSVEVTVEFPRQKILVGLNPDVHLETAAGPITGFEIRDDDGKEVAFQIVDQEKDGHGLRYNNYSYPSKQLVERFELLVDVKNVRGLSFASYRVEQSESFPAYETNLCSGANFLENDDLRVEAQTDGSLDILDKRNKQWFTGIHVFEDGGDAGDEYNYSYPAQDRIITSKGTKCEIHLRETGPLRAVLEIQQSLEIPSGLEPSYQRRSTETVELKISTKVKLYYNQPWLECETKVENDANDHRLRVQFPTGFHTDLSYADSQFGITKREHRPVENPQDYAIEVPSSVHPMQRGVTILDGDRGLTLATAGLTEYELITDEPGTLAVTLLRCVGRLSGGDLLTRPGGEAGWITDAPEAQCQGTHTFEYAIIPHSAREFHDHGYMNKQIEAFLLPCRAQRCGGERAIDYKPFGLTLTPSSLVVSAFKSAEDRHGYVLRFYNPKPERVPGKLESALPLQEAFWTQLNERNGECLEIKNQNVIQFIVEPFQIVSFRLLFTVKS